MASKIHFPPLLIRDDQLNESDTFWQSDCEDEFPSKLQTHEFYPKWSSVISGSFDNVNSFCPYCGSFVQSSEKMETQVQGVNSVCYAHIRCIQKKQNSKVQLKYKRSIFTLQKGNLEITRSKNMVGSKEFVLSTSISHPLSSYKYFRNDRKIIMEEGNVLFDLNPKTQIWNDFNVNKILLPVTQMNFNICLKEIGSEGQQQNIDFNVDLSQIFVGLQITEKHSTWVINFSNSPNWTTRVQIQLIFDQNEKINEIETMNFKYQHSLIPTIPLVKINKIALSPKNHQEKIIKLGIEHTKASSNFEDVYEDTEQESVVSSSSIPCIEVYEVKNTSEIRNFPKTLSGSKEIQRRLKEMKTQELGIFIDEITPYMREFLEDDYANYMIQTLVSYSNSQQRLKIFKSLSEDIVHLVCLKQGTFALQQMISYMDNKEEFMFFGQLMADNFLQVSTNPNGNHFLRKLISMMPFCDNKSIINAIFSNFVQLVNNKNSVCVLKVILRILSKQGEKEVSKEIVQKIAIKLASNTEQIVRNEFGNYFIQEFFEVFGADQLKEVSEMIFTRFKILAKEKFSSSVICKCISSYWRDTNYLERLKSKLNSNDLIELFKNKEGNKVLVELMHSRADEGFKNRILKAISKFLPSKFNSSKWASIGGGNLKHSKRADLSSSDNMKESEEKMVPVTKKSNYIIH